MIFGGFHIYHYKEILSTNKEALDLVVNGMSNEIVIIADKQIKGRGRAGKSWISPKGNFYASLIINLSNNYLSKRQLPVSLDDIMIESRNQKKYSNTQLYKNFTISSGNGFTQESRHLRYSENLMHIKKGLCDENSITFSNSGVITDARHKLQYLHSYISKSTLKNTRMIEKGGLINQVSKLTELTFVIALAVGNTILSLTNDITLQYKWPNDILIEGKKISGILLEKKSNSNWLIIGVGININYAPLSGTTCIVNYGRSVSNTDLLKELIVNFNKLRKKWMFDGFYAIREMWLKKAFKMSEQISVRLAEKLYEGIFTDIDKSGKLVLKQKDGSLIYFDAGELFIDSTL